VSEGESIDIRDARIGEDQRAADIFLYGLAGLRELTNICAFVWHGGTFDLGWIPGGPSSRGRPFDANKLDSFQVYFTYVIVAIFVIRLKWSAFQPQLISRRGGSVIWRRDSIYFASKSNIRSHVSRSS
jgi:hypothetical protein